MSEEPDEPLPSVIVHVCTTRCAEGEHDWSGPVVERTLPGGGGESTATCAKCAMEFGHWALFNLE